MKQTENSGGLSAKSVCRVSVLFFWIAAILGGSAAAIVLAAERLNGDQILRPEIVLPLIVIVGVIALLATLAVTAATFGLFNISDRKQALGLPPGSVQAVIALNLILIFAVVALYASSTSGIQEFESTGLTQAQVDAIPQEELVSSNPDDSGEGTFTVVRGITDPDKNSINTQLLTTVSTLVVAVAGFFFGSKSVQEGNKAVKEGIEAAIAPHSLILVKPRSPYTWQEADESLEIEVRSTPVGAKLRSSVQNDDESQLGEVNSGIFVYRPGKDVRKPGTVTLQFAQVEDPTASATLIVNFPDEGQKGAENEPPSDRGTPQGGERDPNLVASRREKLRRYAKERGFRIGVTVRAPSASPGSPS